MVDAKVYYPAKKWGMLFHLISISILIAGVAIGLWQAAHSPTSPYILLYLSIALLSVALLPVLVYRLYSLWSGSYSLERDGIRIRWGFRTEDVPVNTILAVRPAEDLKTHLPLPFMRWPGAVLGVRQIRLGEYKNRRVEYLADRESALILIVTPERILAISPLEREAFLKAYQRYSEMGSLTPLAAKSIYPEFLFPEIWEDARARILVLGGIILALFLFVGVSLLIPNYQQISLRISPTDSPVDYVPSAQLLLLPVMNVIFFLADISLGLFFYRRPELRSLAYLMWGSSMMVSLLFIGAVIFIARAA